MADYTFKEIKDYLRKQPVIYFKGLEVTEKNPEKFIRNFFEYNKLYPTIYKNNLLQTETNKRRSVGDIFRLVYYYFPNTAITTVYKTLFNMIAEGKALSSICQQTGLRVYRATKTNEIPYLNGLHTDEFGCDLDKFKEIKLCKASMDNWGYNYGEKEIQKIKIK